MRQLRLSLVLFLSLLPALHICCITYASDPAPDGIDLVLVMDVSGSMMRSDPDYHCRQAALSLMEDLAKIPASRMAVTAFSDQLVLSSSLISLDTPAGLSAISDCLHAVSYTRGDTDIGLAMQQAAQLLLQESGPDHARCILLLTDGEIDLPKAANEEAAENDSLTKVLVAVEDSIDSGIVIHTVMLDPTGALDPSLCRYMADRTGGSSVITADSSSLTDIFHTVSEYVRSQAAALTALPDPETEAETETETEEETEVQTEPAVETETVITPMIVQTGTIDSPVVLSGLLPGMCRASLDLSGLFRYEDGESFSGDGSESIQFSVHSSDPSCLQCMVEGNTLKLRGNGRGTCAVTICAESTDSPDTVHSDPVRFEVSVRPVFTAAWIPILTAAVLATGTAALIFLLRLLTGQYLTGSLQWYIRSDSQKIFGVPSQTRAELDVYGKKAVLSELIDDELLEDVDLSRVKITGRRSGIRICSRTRNILLSDSEGTYLRYADLEETSDIRILCRTQNGSISIMARYLEPGEDTGYKDADASDERTRMLINDDHRMAG